MRFLGRIRIARRYFLASFSYLNSYCLLLLLILLLNRFLLPKIFTFLLFLEHQHNEGWVHESIYDCWWCLIALWCLQIIHVSKCRNEVSPAPAFCPVVNCVTQASTFRYQGQSGTAGHGIIRHCPCSNRKIREILRVWAKNRSKLWIQERLRRREWWADSCTLITLCWMAISPSHFPPRLVKGWCHENHSSCILQ